MIALGGGMGAVCVVGLVWYYFTPKFWRAGYMPDQPSITVSYEAERRPDEIDLFVASLDRGQSVEIQAHWFWTERVDWLHIEDDLPKE